MSQLLACLGRCHQDDTAENSNNVESIVKLATTVAAMALFLCGKRAAAVISHVESNADEYEPMLVQHVSNIRKEACRLENVNERKKVDDVAS